jgi:protein ImuB
MTGPTPTRTLVLWSPDWPVTAAVREHSLAPNAPIALIDRGVVFACSAAARAEGVARGLRLREAQSRCTGLIVLPYEPIVDARTFEPVMTALEALTPGVQVLRPGTIAVRARGPAAYYGGEQAAALALIGCLAELGIAGARVGIADGPFAAEQAARGVDTSARMAVTIVPHDGSPAFLAPLPVSILGDGQLATLLRRLGIRFLGEFSRLQQQDVRERFGESGAWLHTLASGLDGRGVAVRTPPALFDRTVDFEPALDRVDQVAFGVLAVADEFIAGLTAARLVCTAMRVEIASDSGEVSGRSWLHPRSFTAGEIVDRVRWQLQGSGEIDTGLSSGIVRVHIAPESVDSIGNHEHGLWGTGPDERIHHGLSRVQSMLGHEAVLTAEIAGGRSLADRQRLVAWGDRAAADPRADTNRATQPWPGQLPQPAPATVFAVPHPVHVFSADGESVRVDARGVLSAPPTHFSATAAAATLREVVAWAGPWTVDERWWDATTASRASRFQLVDAAGTAWLAACVERQGSANWVIEARYD